MLKNIGYHTRLYADNTVKVTGGSFGGAVDMETVDRLTRLFDVAILPSGTAVFVDREGRHVRLYISVDAATTEKGRAALTEWRKARALAEEQARQQAEAEETELARAMEGLPHEEILRRLRGQ